MSNFISNNNNVNKPESIKQGHRRKLDWEEHCSGEGELAELDARWHSTRL